VHHAGRELHTCKIVKILARVLMNVQRRQNGGGQDNAFRGIASFLGKDNEALKVLSQILEH
jgi:hypothetical protein